MRIFYFAIFFIISTSLYAQRTQISGTVKDNTGEALIGVTVVVKGTTQGTATDIDGNYVLELDPGSTLLFSFIGYESKEIIVGNQSRIDVTLKEDISELEEVVVVGYGTINKRELTNAVTTLKAEEISDVPVPSIDQAIQGRIAGVQVTKGTGAPGGGINVRIRGTASIFGGQEPLYIVDGVPINNTFTGSIGQGGENAPSTGFAGNEVNNGLANINPDDIESIEVLKDAAAASIYGSRAANGVVLITTKRGKPGALRTDIKMYTGFSFQPRRYDLLNATEYAAVTNEGLISSGNLQSAITETPYDTDWQDEIFRMASMTSATITLSGGTEKTQYLFSPAYFKQEGVLINSEFERYSFRTNLDHKFNENLKIGTNLSLSNTISQRLRNNGDANVQASFNGNSFFGPSVLSSALVASPRIPVRDPATGFFATDSLNNYDNPVALAELNDLVNNSLRIVGNVYLEASILEDFSLRLNLGTDIRDENEIFEGIAPPPAAGGRILRRSFRESLWVGEAFMTYDKNINDNLSLNILGGGSFQQSRNDGFSVGIQDLLIDEDRSLGASTNFTNPLSDEDARYSIASLFTRLRFSLFDKYFFNATVRRDFSSRFGDNRRTADFPSASFAWNIIDESWFDVPAVTNLKLRVSWGLTGNDQIPGFRYLGTLEVLAENYIGLNGVRLRNLENPDYSWESTEQVDIGIEIGLLDNRLQIVSDYYIKTTRDLLLPRELPLNSGITENPFINVGDMENRGFELGVNAIPIRNSNFEWSSNFNIAFNRQEVLRLIDEVPIVGGNNGIMNIFTEGEELYFQGFQLEETVDPETGYRRIKDLNNNGIRDDGDFGRIGTPLPIHFGGFTNSFRYKKFDLNIFLQWSYGNDIVNNTRGYVQSATKLSLDQSGPNLSREALDRWQSSETDATYPVIDFTPDTFGPSDLRNIGGAPNDQNLEDASYLKLRNVSLGYNFDTSFLEKYSIRSLRAYVTAHNIAMLTSYSGFDPEVNHTVTNNIGIGYDNGTFPQSRSVIVGLNIGL